MEMVSGCRCDGAPAEGVVRLSMRRSYGICIAAVEGPRARFARWATLALMAIAVILSPPARAQATRPVKVVVLGDSLTAGLGLPASAAFPVRLQKALKAKGIET